MVEDSNEQSLSARPAGWLANVKQFWHEVVSEMKKVSWPARPEVVNTTIIVIIAVIFFSVFLFFADILLTYLIQGIEWVAKKLLV